MWRKVKKVISTLLIVSMIIPSNPAFAESVNEMAAEIKEEISQSKYVNIEGQRHIKLSENEEKNIIYFGVQKVEANEKNGKIYNIPIYRDGDLTKEASAMIRTFDVASLYGKDYILLGDNKVEFESDMTLLERAMKLKYDFDFKQISYDYDIENDLLEKKDIRTVVLNNESGNRDTNKENSKIENNVIIDDDGGQTIEEFNIEVGNEIATKSALALWKENMTGQKSRESQQLLANSLTDAIMEKLTPEIRESIIFSCEQEIVFKEGESEKNIQVKILDDKEEEGSEMFSLNIISTIGATNFGGQTVSVMIKDDEKIEFSKLSFEKKEYKLDENNVTKIKIIRTGSEHTMATVVIKKTKSNVNNKEDKNEKEVKESDNWQSLGIVAFAPYENEKEIELELEDGDILKFDDYEASKAGEISSTKIIKKENRLAFVKANDTPKLLKGSNGVNTFDIKVLGKEYQVRYKSGDKFARMYDKNVSPPVEAGIYYFMKPKTSGGMWKYNVAFGNSTNPGPSTYYSDTGKVVMTYYDKYDERKVGGIGVTYEVNNEIPVPFSIYNFIAPRWDLWSSSTQGAYAEIKGSTGVLVETSHGSTSITKDVSIKYRDKKTANINNLEYGMYVLGSQMHGLGIYVGDYSNRYLAKGLMDVWGLASLYKKFYVEVQQPDPLKYMVQNGNEKNYQSVQPVTGFKLDSGVTENASRKYVYANIDKNNSVLKFSSEASTINIGTSGMSSKVSGRFGKIKGYYITIDTEGKYNPVTINYPDDFINALKRIKIMSDKELAEYEKNIKADMSKISVDEYFCWYVYRMNKEYMNNINNMSGPVWEYDQSNFDKYKKSWFATFVTKLKIKPIYTYIDVKCTVMPAAGRILGIKEGGRFKYYKYVKGKSNEYIFHAGDTIDLTTEIDEGFSGVGYQVSVDGDERFNTMRDTHYLTMLGEHNNYRIRPEVQDVRNKIELHFGEEFEKNEWLKQQKNELLKYCSVIPQDILPDDLKEKRKDKTGSYYILQTRKPKDKEKLTWEERSELNPNSVYPIHINLQKGGGTIVFIDSETGNMYQGPVYHKKAGISASDNIIEVHAYAYNTKIQNNTDNLYIKNKGANYAFDKYIKFVDFAGHIKLEMKALRQSDTTKKTIVPAMEYTVTTNKICKEYETVIDKVKIKHVECETGAVVDKDGSFIIEDLPLITCLRKTFLVGNSAGADDVLEYVPNFSVTQSNNIKSTESIYELKKAKQTIEPLILGYNFTYPEFLSLVYNFTGIEKIENTKNSIPLYDGNLKFNLIIDRKDRTIKGVVYKVYHKDGSFSRDFVIPTTTLSTGGISSQYELSLDNPGEYFKDGDYLTICMTESMVDADGKEIMEFHYPEINTGLEFVAGGAENIPKELNFDPPEISPEVPELPLLDLPFGDIKTGQFTMQRIRDDDNKGWSLNLNADVCVYGKQQKLTNKEKVDSLNSFMDTVRKSNKMKKEALEKGKRATNEGMRATAISKKLTNGDTSEWDGSYTKEQKELENKDADESYTDSLKTGDPKEKNPIATLTKDAKVTVNVIFCMNFHFRLDSTQQYILDEMACTAGGTFNISKTWYRMVAFVPCYLNLNGTVQANLMMGGVLEDSNVEINEVIKTDDLNKQLKEKGELFTEFDLILIGVIKVGAGMCGILSAYGFVDACVQIQSLSDNFVNKGQADWGVLLKGEGGIGMDLLLFSVKFTVAKVKKGWGTLQSEDEEVEFFKKPTFGASEEFGVTSYSNDNLLSEINEYKYGTSNMRIFGKSNDNDNNLFGGIPYEKNRKILLENAADRTRPKIIDLGGGKKFVTFIGNRNTAGDKSTLYYTIYNGTSWSMPKVVDDDGTTDQTVSIVKVGNDKIFVAYIDANKKIDEISDFKEKYNSFNISGKLYNILTDTFDDEVTIVNNEFLNMAPRAVYVNGKVFVTYFIRDISNKIKVDDLLNLYDETNTMAYSIYDVSTNTVSDSVPIMVNTKTQNDALVLDYYTDYIVYDSKNYLLSTYSIDEDKNVDTATDREIYISIWDVTDVNNIKKYYPIRITTNEKAEIAPKLFKIKDELFIAYLTDNKIFNVGSISDIIMKPLFGNSEVSDSYKNRDKTKPDWYKLSKEDVLHENIKYEDSIYYDLFNENVIINSTSIYEDEEMGGGVDNYTLVTDGTDLFIMYTDFDKQNIKSNGNELFAIRYRDVFSNLSETVATDSNMRQVGFTSPVQLTKYGYVLDEYDLFMTEEHNIDLVSDYYMQWIDKDGKLQLSENKLVEINYETAGSMEILPYSMEVSGNYTTGKDCNVKFEVKNTGLYEAEGFNIQIDAIKVEKPEELGDLFFESNDEPSGAGGGVIDTIEIFESDYDVSLDVNEKYELSVPFVPNQDLDNYFIRVVVMEKNVLPTGYSVIKKIPYEEKLVLTERKINYSDGKYTFEGKVLNDGSIDAKPYTIKLLNSDKEGNIGNKAYYSKQYDTLKVGETQDILIDFNVEAEDYDKNGKLIVGVQFERDGEKLVRYKENYYALNPETIYFENNVNSMKVDVGKTKKVNVLVAPFNENAGKPEYYVENAGVCSVDENGNVKGLMKGETKITICYPKYLLYKEMTVKVLQSQPVKPSGGGSGGGGSDYGNYSIGAGGSGIPGLNAYSPNAVDGKPNTWQYDALTNKWYRIGADGKSVYGWFLDTDGRWYYLGDGCAMSDGMQCIGGKWYYFAVVDEPLTGKMRGEMYVNAMTPIGYYAGADGSLNCDLIASF